VQARALKATYDRSAVKAGIVHLGIGAFHRAHQAVYLDDLLVRVPAWGIIGVSLKSTATAEALNSQNGLYTLAVRGSDGTHHRVIGSVLRVLTAKRDTAALLAAMSDPAIRIISLTITEKGYCHDPASGKLDEKHPDILIDLENPHTPCSGPGFIVEALRRRWQSGCGPVTIMSCDNLPMNGQTTRQIVLRLAALRDPSLAAWIEDQVTFPCTMVDRIVPATTEMDRAAIRTAIGLDDACPVLTEPFTQWVIEDRFCAGRPAFEQVGAEMVADVKPYELMKLRMLNGSHSTLAYLGYLAGYKTVAQVMSQPGFVQLITGMMTDEIMPTLNMPAGVDLLDYRNALIARFKNPNLEHKTAQIAMDGSQKLPQRVLGTIRDRLAKGASFKRLALCVAGWMRYVAGCDEHGNTIAVRDPLAAKLLAIGDKHGGDPHAMVHAFCAIKSIFGEDLVCDERFTATVTIALARLYKYGAGDIRM